MFSEPCFKFIACAESHTKFKLPVALSKDESVPLWYTDRSEPVPNFALILSWNTTWCADASNSIVLLPAATKVTSSEKFDVELASIAPLNVETPDIFNLLLVVTPLTLIPCGVVWSAL